MVDLGHGKPLVSDELWAIVAPLLPPEPPKPKGGRPRVSDRAALTGIIFVLKSGIPWEMLPQEMGCGSGVTCWRRLRDWQQAGVWDRAAPHAARSAGRSRPHRLEPGVSGLGQHPGQKGGDAVGPNPTDRGKPGTKRHIVVDRAGIPLASAPDRSQPPRLGRLRGAARCHPADQDSRRAAAQATRQAPRRQGLRLSPAAGRRSRAATSGSASRARASSPASAWVATAGSSSARWPGSTAIAA